MDMSSLPASGFVRLSNILAPKGPLPISRSTWFTWRRDGRAPEPVMLSPRIAAYRAEDIHALLSRLTDGDRRSA